MEPVASSTGVVQQEAVPPAGEATLCEFRYGVPQPLFFWLTIAAGIGGCACVPIGLFWNKGWAVNNFPMSPLAATLMFESMAAVGILLCVYFVGGYLYQRKQPQRVALTPSAVLVPKGTFSRLELRLPLAELRVQLRDSGPAKQLYLKHRGGTVHLRSVLFASEEEFDRFARLLTQRAGPR